MTESTVFWFDFKALKLNHTVLFHLKTYAASSNSTNKLESPVQPASAGHSVNGSRASILPSQTVASSSGPEPLPLGSQVLQDLMELAEDGMTLTQCGFTPTHCEGGEMQTRTVGWLRVRVFISAVAGRPTFFFGLGASSKHQVNTFKLVLKVLVNTILHQSRIIYFCTNDARKEKASSPYVAAVLLL